MISGCPLALQTFWLRLAAFPCGSCMHCFPGEALLVTFRQRIALLSALVLFSILAGHIIRFSACVVEPSTSSNFLLAVSLTVSCFGCLVFLRNPDLVFANLIAALLPDLSVCIATNHQNFMKSFLFSYSEHETETTHSDRLPGKTLTTKTICIATARIFFILRRIFQTHQMSEDILIQSSTSFQSEFSSRHSNSGFSPGGLFSFEKVCCRFIHCALEIPETSFSTR